LCGHALELDAPLALATALLALETALLAALLTLETALLAEAAALLVVLELDPQPAMAIAATAKSADSDVFFIA
jgi:hypothetical protein